MRGLRRRIYDAVRRKWAILRYRKKIFDIQRALTAPKVRVDQAKAREYWRKHFGARISTRWHSVYARTNGYDDVRFVPEDIFYTDIEQALCSVELARAYCDKNFYTNWIPERLLPQAVLRCIHGRLYTPDYSPAIPEGLLAEEERYFIKPSLLSGGGRDVEVLSLKAGAPVLRGHTTSWADLVTAYEGNFVVERALAQHAELAAVNPSSINTLRITTLRLDEPRVLSSVLRSGRAGSHVDNQHAGGVTCAVGPDGRFVGLPSAPGGIRVPAHPDTGYVFSGKEVPGITEAWQTVAELHKRLFYFDLASWDVSIDPQGKPVVIEVNLRFQSINIHQMCNGPLFGDMTEEVLKYARERRRILRSGAR